MMQGSNKVLTRRRRRIIRTKRIRGTGLVCGKWDSKSIVTAADYEMRE